MSHPFGDLLSQYLHRKHGLSQSRLADGIMQPPSVISEMCKGQRLTGPQARSRVIAIIDWLQRQDALETLDDATALLDAAGMSPLHEREPIEAEITRRFHSSSGKLQGRPQQAASFTYHTPSRSIPVRRTPLHHNLPTQLTPFIGRTEQITQLVQEVRAHRLLTLTGPGGVGKTRLALEVAAKLLDWFADGVWFIDLGPLADPDLLPQSILEVLKASKQPIRSPLATLTTHLRAKHLLLILDNCEHLVDAAAGTAEEVLRVCPQVHLLATGSEALHIGAEIPGRCHPSHSRHRNSSSRVPRKSRIAQP